MIKISMSKEILPPFKRFAFYYDEFMLRVVNYRDWVRYVVKIFEYYKLDVQRILDLACGSGIPSILLAENGYEIIGIDSSQEMLAVFASKIINRNLKITLKHADMRDFTLDKKVDACVSFYDSINYLLTYEDLCRCFNSVAQALKSGGIFTFDMNTVFCLEHFWDNKKSPRVSQELYTIWENTYDPIKRISTLHLTVKTKTGEVFSEIHQERGYYPYEISNALTNAGFNKIDFYEHGTFEPISEVTLRMMVVAQKP
ncbi:MAG: class I SAM-dependent methyltransferase [candidate division WOR-3 bacterium]|nr:class I SAM-dependent methyltransferase [candidate division WOR-3 bacterium]MCX7757731.1 class I SAM-dependent methyltransferase [candidate division WOR-3 bacterium]MDW7988156.1 class I SAM-dependent methyltransferase [candidate division WOR-3 bacterium]